MSVISKGIFAASRQLNWQAPLVVALLACACGSKSTDPNQAFAKYFADGNAWCAFEVKCGGTTQTDAQCLADWPTSQEILAAIDAEKFTQSELDRCEQAAHAIDDCGLMLTCEQWTMPETCKSEHQAYTSFCQQIDAAIQLQVDKRSPSGSPMDVQPDGGAVPSGCQSTFSQRWCEPGCAGPMCDPSLVSQCDPPGDAFKPGAIVGVGEACNAVLGPAYSACSPGLYCDNAVLVTASGGSSTYVGVCAAMSAGNCPAP